MCPGLMVPLLFAGVPTDDGGYFTIEVVDEQTGRGVPLVELQTVNNIRYYTDSNGIVAFHEPGLMDQRVFFHVKSHGYEFPKDGFGYQGQALDVSPGGSATLPIKRLNIPERLYRVTGQGIYRDSLLVGRPVPTSRPVLNAQVFGSDSVVNAIYRQRIYWFWGDTNRPGYPLGNFHVPGATSLLPSDGGLDPNVGVDLSYFVDEKGFAKETCRMPGEGPTWIGGLVVLRDGSGRERLFAAYVKVRKLLEVYERGLVEFDDEGQQFRKVTDFPLDAPLLPTGHPFTQTIEGTEYVYFADPYPLTRAPATPEALADLSTYEAFTCLQPGSRLDDPAIDRDADGRVQYGWKRNTPPVGPQEQAELVKAGKLRPEEALLHLQDCETGEPVLGHRGSAYWNEYRKRWVMIVCQSFGTSMLGEIWYAEADDPLGPWVYARKIVTHEKYSFYNPKQHPMFDQEDGRIIFFEGTYTHTFSGNPDPTPWYDYNQVMYRLDLADRRLALPVPVYDLSERVGANRFGTARDLQAENEAHPIAFFALNRPGEKTVPVYAQPTQGQAVRLEIGQPDASEEQPARPVFHALPAEMPEPPATTAPLYEFVHEAGVERAYSTDDSLPLPGYERSEKPLCLVWKNPMGIGLPRS